MENKKDGLIKLTGLWEKKGKKGVYFKGKLGYLDLLIFENQYKSSVQDPDYILYLARPGKRLQLEKPVEPEEDIEPF